MHSPHVPWQVLSSTLGVGILTEGWTLDAEPESDAARTFSVPVAFASTFSTAPVVHLGITGFDVDQRDSSRITLRAEDITEGGFTAVISTWASTRVFAVEFNWFAIGG